jgi:hypothetical protein
MNTSVHSSEPDVSEKRLWFGFSGAAAAWVFAGITDASLAWFACMGGEVTNWPFTTTGMHVMLGLITFGLLAIATVGGIVSFKNWRKLSESGRFIEAEARGRKQFMAMIGVFISLSLGLGIIWFAIPVYILGVCVRAR